jgi:peptidyl-prolyl cis-trans isomerase SurA
MKRKLWMLAAASFISTFSCQALPATNQSSFTRLDKIIVIVNREAITLSQLNKEMELYTKQLEQSHQPLPEQTKIKKDALDNLIAKSLQRQMCQAKGLAVKDEEVDKALESVAKANHLQRAQLKQAIEQTGINYDKYLDQIRDQILFQKLQQEEVAKNVNFTPEDVKKYLRENPSLLNQYSAFHVMDILVPANEKANDSQIAPIKKQATELASQLQTGKDPEMVLKQFPSAEKNDLGWRNMTEIPSLFQQKVASLKIKGVSQPIQAPNGFHILQLVDAKGDQIKPTENDIKNIVFQQKMMDAVKVWIAKIRSEAYIKYVN